MCPFQLFDAVCVTSLHFMSLSPPPAHHKTSDWHCVSIWSHLDSLSSLYCRCLSVYCVRESSATRLMLWILIFFRFIIKQMHSMIHRLWCNYFSFYMGWALHTGRLYSSGNISDTSVSCRVDPGTLVRSEGSGYGTHDIAACSAVSQPTAPPRLGFQSR